MPRLPLLLDQHSPFRNIPARQTAVEIDDASVLAEILKDIVRHVSDLSTVAALVRTAGYNRVSTLTFSEPDLYSAARQGGLYTITL